ncbi:MAG: glucosaminidase domain-containing protein [Prevotella sp.]|nr:glucosaminidase domain-containing protein [Prevotella sp.]
MISIKALGMYSSDFSGGETRNGDTQIATDGKNFDVIDGGCDRYATRLSAHLKSINIRDPYLHISHCHYDHRDGIDKILSDPWFKPRGLYCQNPDSITGHSSAIRSDINALRKIIDKAKSKGIPVIYLGNEDKIEHGEIKITVYRQYPKYTGNSDAYLNDGSLCYWFAALRYLTTGDASMWCAYKYNLNPLIVKGGHHGNDMSADGYLKPSQMCPWLYKHGCRFYWDNDFSTRLTDFLMTGREDAINAGMTFIDIHGDIDMIFAEGKVTISHGGKTYTAAVPYQGKMLTGSWEQGSKGWWYRYPDGTWATGWRQIEYKGEPKWFLFDKDGWMLTGWRYEGWSGGESWFFMDYQTGVMKTGWNMLPWGDGKMDTFLLDPKTGAMLTGWQYSTKDGKAGWYYLDPKSGAMHTGWIFENGYWYFLGADGCMVTGWVDWKGRKCYLEPVSGRNQGHCYTSCVDTIGGKTYSFDADGYATEISGSTTAEAPTIIKNSGFHAGRNCGTRTEKVKYIAIHYTGNDGATAAENVSYFNGGNRGASAHYFVDHSGEIREYCDPAAYYSWHCGGPLESSHHPLHDICTNRNSIGIEICTRKSGGVWTFTSAAVNSAIALTKYLMTKFGVSADHVCRHYDVTGKACPRVPGWGAVGGDAEWKKFLAAITIQARPLTDNEKFIEEIGAMARADMAKSGICAAVTVAQAILESGWGKSDLAMKAKNIFGMKCSLSGNTWPGSSWDGKSSYNKSTGEYYSGSYTTVKADFRAYKSWAESVADHSAYLAGAKNGSALRYAGLVGCTDYRKAAQIIKNGGYATSPDYVTKICNIVEQYNLVRFNTNYSAPVNTKPATTVTPAPASKVPYLVRVGSGVQIYKAPAGAVAKTCPYGVYTIVEEKNGYGKLKSGAGWLKLGAVTKV